MKMQTLVLLAALLGCDTSHQVCVKVVSCNNADKPLLGARVVIPARDAEMFTDATGEACDGGLDTLDDKPFEISVDKPTYQPKTITADPPGGAHHFDITVCLAPASE